MYREELMVQEGGYERLRQLERIKHSEEYVIGSESGIRQSSTDKADELL